MPIINFDGEVEFPISAALRSCSAFPEKTQRETGESRHNGSQLRVPFHYTPQFDSVLCDVRGLFQGVSSVGPHDTEKYASLSAIYKKSDSRD